MGGIRFFTKTETDGKQTLRIEVPEDATRDDLESAWGEMMRWHDERTRESGRFFSHVREQAEFDFQVHRLYARGYSPARIAWMANAELLDMLRQYQTERSTLDFAGDSAAVSIMRWWHAHQLLQRVHSFLIAARPRWTVDKRREEIDDALAALALGTADRECLIDRETIRRSIERWSDLYEGSTSARRKGRKLRKVG